MPVNRNCVVCIDAYVASHPSRFARSDVRTTTGESILRSSARRSPRSRLRFRKLVDRASLVTLVLTMGGVGYLMWVASREDPTANFWLVWLGMVFTTLSVFAEEWRNRKVFRWSGAKILTAIALLYSLAGFFAALFNAFP